MKLGELEQQCRQPIERGIRESFRRSSRYQDCIKSSRVTKPRFKKDGSRAKRDHVFHTCNICKKLFKSTEIQVDHVTPVIPLSMQRVDLSINQLLNRIWNLPIQVACKICHSIKTKSENKTRREFKSKSK